MGEKKEIIEEYKQEEGIEKEGDGKRERKGQVDMGRKKE
jgi:hypothetical protein